MAHPEPLDWLATPCEHCQRPLRACHADRCEYGRYDDESEQQIAEIECHPSFMDPVAWASENRYDPEAQADLELHDMLHPFGYGR